MDYGLRGKSAIVTGAAGGIGIACCRSLANEGADVVVADLDGSKAESIAHELGTKSIGIGADVSSPQDAQRVVGTAIAIFGRLDVLVTCAGVFHATPLDEITAAEWDTVQEVNLRGTFLVAQAALEAMIPRGRGRIVTVASLAGQTGGIGAGASYASSKAGVVALTKSIARFAGPHGINANCVSPGLIDTPMLVDWPRETLERTIAATPLARLGTAEEVAETVVWLASDRASFVHGAHVDVNGGLYMS